MFADDLADTIEAATGAPIYIGAWAERPRTRHVVITPTAGAGPEYVQNQAAPAYETPGAQVIACDVDGRQAQALARACYDAVASVRNATIGSTWYLSIRPRQEPFGFGLDPSKTLAQFAFNVIAEKRPS